MNLLLFSQTQSAFSSSPALSPVLSVVSLTPDTTGVEALIGSLESLGEGSLYDLHPVSVILLASRRRIHSTDRIA